MKKSILFFPFVFVVILVVIFSSVLLPHIKLGITIQPQYQSTAKADKPEKLSQGKAHCIVLSEMKTDKITDSINAYYDKGYRLKSFSATSTKIAIDTLVFFAAVCKE